MKRIIALFFAIILLACISITAFADVYIEYCPACEQNTMWRDACSGNPAGNSSYGSHTTVPGTVCNTYYAYKYNGRKCNACGNIYTFAMKHVHTWVHSVCSDQNWCPY